MANNFSSNNVEDLAKGFLAEFESNRVVINTVDVQKFKGKYTASTGGEVSLKRPHQAQSSRTSGGDITSETKSDIIAGKVTGVVQDYVTVHADWTVSDEQLKFDEMRKIMQPFAEETVIVLETSLQDFMIKNGGACVGNVGTALDAWEDVGYAGAHLKSVGAPKMGDVTLLMNPYTTAKLAGAQQGISTESLVRTAWEKAQLSTPFAGMTAITSNAMSAWTVSASADQDGTLSGTPDATYVTAKDSMTQSIAVTGLTGTAVVKAGDVLEFTGTGANARSIANPRNHNTLVDGDGDAVKWRCTVTADVTLAGGAGTLVVTPAAIKDSTQTAYNNISSALVSTDAFTIQGTASKEYQPNLIYNKEAFGMTTIPIPRIEGWDTTYVTTKDGISIRVTKYGDATTNENKIRFDLWPVFGVFNPFWGGKAFGLA